MGGRGASSGISEKGKPYGTEYKTVLQYGNIKFLQRNEGNASAPLETRTKGRVYVTVNNNQDLKYISYYDRDNKKFKQIDLDHTHYVNGVKTQPHTHRGYLHNEDGDYELSIRDQKMVARVISIWYNRKSK